MAGLNFFIILRYRFDFFFFQFLTLCENNAFQGPMDEISKWHINIAAIAACAERASSSRNSSRGTIRATRINLCSQDSITAFCQRDGLNFSFMRVIWREAT